MLKITVPSVEMFDDRTAEFIVEPEVQLELEHSLVSLSKWEEKFEKPFLENKDPTTEETVYYVQCMILNPEIAQEVILRLTSEHYKEINEYMNRKMTASWITETEPKTRNHEIITAELIYYWMTVFNMPLECEQWHLNKLFTFIQIANVKQSKPKKMSRSEIAQRNRQLNEQRKAQYGTNG